MFENKEVYVFGYGSLMYPDGFDERGMKHLYSNEEIIPVHLDGYERGLYASIGNTTYYGIIAKSNTSINGTIAKIHSRTDFISLNISEHADPTGRDIQPHRGEYVVTDVTSQIRYNDDIYFSDKHPDAICYTYAIREKCMASISKNTPSSQWYIEYVDDGIRHLGDKFIKEFIQTSSNK